MWHIVYVIISTIAASSSIREDGENDEAKVASSMKNNHHSTSENRELEVNESAKISAGNNDDNI